MKKFDHINLLRTSVAEPLVGAGTFCLNKFFLWLKLESLLFLEAGAGAGEKNTRSRSRSKIDRLRNTGVRPPVHEQRMWQTDKRLNYSCSGNRRPLTIGRKVCWTAKNECARKRDESEDSTVHMDILNLLILRSSHG